jgi:uncharacterized membrane protein HdeD (DUF308 family)
MSTIRPNIDRFERAFAASVREHWRLLLVEGVILVILGVAAVIVPPVASLAATIFLGWLLMVSGIVGLIATFWMRSAPGFWWSLLSAAISIVAGGLLIGWPVSGVLSLTFVLIVFFIVDGIATIMYALDHRRELSDRWGWMLASGIIDLILAAVIIAGLPGTAAWALGLLVGINMVFGGFGMITMALAARRGELA